MYLIALDQVDRIVGYASAVVPREACGLLVRTEARRGSLLSIIPTSIEDNTPISFRIRVRTIEEIKESLKGSKSKVCGCFHSHVVGRARPSKGDRAGVKEPGELWLIYAVQLRTLRLYAWNGNIFQRKCYKIAL